MATQEKKFRFRVKPGMVFGPAGVNKAGSIVTLTAAEAVGFEDKLIPLGPDFVELRNDLNVQIAPDQKLLPDDADDEGEGEGEPLDGPADDSAEGKEFNLQGEPDKPAKTPKPKTQRKKAVE